MTKPNKQVWFLISSYVLPSKFEGTEIMPPERMLLRKKSLSCKFGVCCLCSANARWYASWFIISWCKFLRDLNSSFNDVTFFSASTTLLKDLSVCKWGILIVTPEKQLRSYIYNKCINKASCIENLFRQWFCLVRTFLRWIVLMGCLVFEFIFHRKKLFHLWCRTSIQFIRNRRNVWSVGII